MIDIEVDGTLRFPLSWMDNIVAITRYTFDYLTVGDIEMAQTLDEFNIMESRTMITFDQRGDKSMDKCLSKFPI